MAVRKVTTQLAVDGEAEFKRQLNSVTSELKNVGAEMRLVDAQFKGQANSAEALTRKQKLLEDAYANQQNKVEALEQAVRDTSAAYGEADPRVDAYRRQLLAAQTALVGLNEDLQKNEKYLNEASESADGFATSIDGFGKEVKDAGGDASGSLGGLRGALSDLRNEDGSFNLSGVTGALGALKGAFVGGAIVTGAKAVKDAIMDVVESTEEYRKIMGTLEVSSQAAGYTTEETTEAYQRLQAVLGDTQQAATATANLQALGLEQEQLMMLIDQAIGAWATYGDSIPIDSLAESINETIQAGKVTGVFADVLNWAGQVAEDDFNTALEECANKAERAQLVLTQFAQQGLTETGQAWQAANEDIMQLNSAQEQLNANMARLGELLSPIAAGFVEFKATVVGEVVEIIEAISALIDKISSLSLVDSIRTSATKVTTPASDYQALLDSFTPRGSHASGLERVPYDGYVAELHRDEMVLTRPQAAAYRAQEQSGGSSAQSVTIDMTLELDGATLARKQYTYNQAEAARRGASRAGKAVP